MSDNCIVLEESAQIRGINTQLLDPDLDRENFIFYFDRMVRFLVERAVECMNYEPHQILTPQNYTYMGLKQEGEVSGVVILRGGCILETGLRRVIPDCRTGRLLIQTVGSSAP